MAHNPSLKELKLAQHFARGAEVAWRGGGEQILEFLVQRRALLRQLRQHFGNRRRGIRAVGCLGQDRAPLHLLHQRRAAIQPAPAGNKPPPESIQALAAKRETPSLTSTVAQWVGGRSSRSSRRSTSC